MPLSVHSKDQMSSSSQLENNHIDRLPNRENEPEEQFELERLGYKQEFKRSYSMWTLIAFGIVTLTPSSAIANTLQLPLESGGPQAFVWGYIIVGIFTMVVATSLAEIAAAFPPVSGGMLSWSYLLPKNKQVKILASWYTGYFNIFAQIAFAASAFFQGGFMIIGVAALNDTNYVPKTFHYVLIAIGFTIFCTFTNIFFNKYHSDMSAFLLVVNLVTIVAIIITLLATAEKRNDAKFIFTNYENFTGFSSKGYVFILGLLQSAFTFTGYDSCSHLAEESSSRSGHNIVPRALVTVVGTCVIYGFVFVIVCCAVIGQDIERYVTSSTGSAFIQLLLDCTKNKGATSFFALVPAILALIAGETMTLVNSRTIYSFARDGAFIFPKYFSKVSDRYGVPVPALILSMVAQCIIIILYFSSDVVFNTILSLATIGHEVAYLIPICCMLFGGRSRLPESRPWNLGVYGVILNWIAVLWLSFISITTFFPAAYPVTTGTMNYSIVIFFLVIFYATIIYIFQGRKTYIGPKEDVDLEEELVQVFEAVEMMDIDGKGSHTATKVD